MRMPTESANPYASPTASSHSELDRGNRLPLKSLLLGLVFGAVATSAIYLAMCPVCLLAARLLLAQGAWGSLTGTLINGLLFGPFIWGVFGLVPTIAGWYLGRLTSRNTWLFFRLSG